MYQTKEVSKCKPKLKPRHGVVDFIIGSPFDPFVQCTTKKAALTRPQSANPSDNHAN